MKRWISIVLASVVAGAASAQAPFTIVRPADGSKVREQVRIQVPENSIPENGYIGVFVGGKFVEAVLPDKKDKFYEYILDTKAREIPDGQLPITLVLYVDYGDKPRKVNESTVTVSVQNSASIPVPDDGFKLRYKFVPGNEFVYDVENRVGVSAIRPGGGRPADLPIDAESIRMLYAVDNAYGDGQGLLRMQALPMKGKDYAILTTSNETQPKKYMANEMAPSYMRITGTGREVFGSVPAYVAMMGSGLMGSYTDLIALFPLPMLPEKTVKPGSTWQTNFQFGDLDLAKRFETDHLVRSVPAVGKFTDVEWEMGFPCAKLELNMSQGGSGSQGLALQMRSGGAIDKVESKETIWFALDRGVVVRMVREMTIEGAGLGNSGNAPGGPSGGGGRGGPAGIGDDPNGGDQQFFIQRGGRGGGFPGRAGGGGAQEQGDDTGAAAQGRGGQRGPGGPGGGGGVAAGEKLRIRIQQIFTLDRSGGSK